jgi:hypothetical protein
MWEKLLYRILNEHPGIFKGNKFKISAEFLLKNGYVFDNNYEDEDYVLEVKHESERISSYSLSEHWEDIESDEEFDYYQEEEVKSKASVETESAEVESRCSDFDVTVGDDYRDYEEVETIGINDEECLEDSEDMDAAPASDDLNELDVDHYPVSTEEEVIYECEKCVVLFESKPLLQGHVDRYHKEIMKCPFCPFKACLADVLEHMGRNCEEDKQESDEKARLDLDEESREAEEGSEENTDDDELSEAAYCGEETHNLALINCDLCDFMTLRVYDPENAEVPKCTVFFVIVLRYLTNL